MGMEPVLGTNLSKFVPWLRNRLYTLDIIYSASICLCCRIQLCDLQNPDANAQLLSDQMSHSLSDNRRNEKLSLICLYMRRSELLLLFSC